MLVPIAALKRDPDAWRKVEAWLIAHGKNVVEVQELGNRGRRRADRCQAGLGRPGRMSLPLHCGQAGTALSCSPIDNVTATTPPFGSSRRVLVHRRCAQFDSSL